jgi:hypothetical protein
MLENLLTDGLRGRRRKRYAPDHPSQILTSGLNQCDQNL